MSQLVINRISPDTAIVGTVHIFTSGRLSMLGSKLLKIIYGRSLRRFDELLSVSPAAQKYAQEAFARKTQLSPNVIDLSTFKRHLTRQKNTRKSVVFLGRLVERKGCEYLLRAFKILHSLLPEVRLVIAGEGPEREKLEKLADNLGISPNVDFLGLVSENQKIELLANADVACFPSLYGESFGIVLLEAMAAGAKVVLGGNNEGYVSVLGKQKELIINPRNIDAFAARLTTLLQDQTLISKIHKWQLIEVRKYDVAVVGPRVEAIYRRAIAMRNKSRHN
jgi:phosphatidylinositol alpha-mannosyltransferase